MDKMEITLDEAIEELCKLLTLVADLRSKEKEEEEEKRWVMLSLSRDEVLACDGCYKDVTAEDVHISSSNGYKKVLCETCWEKKLKGDENNEKER